VKQDQNFFLSAAKGALANSGSDSSLLFLFKNGCSRAPIKVKVVIQTAVCFCRISS